MSTKDVAPQRFILIRHDRDGNEHTESVTVSGPNHQGWQSVTSVTTGQAYAKIRVVDGVCAFMQVWANITRWPNLRAALDALPSRLELDVPPIRLAL